MKKSFILTFSFSLITIGNLFSQITFQKIFTISPEEKQEVFQTSDGGYAIVGRKIIRLNNLGDTLWTKSYIFGSSALTGAVQTQDGGFALSGFTNSAGIGLRDFFLIKTDSLGTVLWSKAYGGLNHDDAYGLSQTTDGGFILTGSTRSVFPGSMCFYMVRTDLNGNLLWAKAIDGNERSQTVIQTNDGGFIASGGATYKMDSIGNIQWPKFYSGPGGEQVKCIRQTTDGGYILTGNSSYFDSVNVIISFVFKIDAAGVLQWSKYFANDYTSGCAVEQTNDGGYIVAVQRFLPATYSDISLIKTNSTGDTLWTRAYGGADFEVPWSVKQTSDGGYIMAASSVGLGYGIYVIKTDSLGNSGCNQLPTAFTIVDSLVSVYTNTVTVSSGGIEAPFTATSTNGTTVIPLCFANTISVNELNVGNAFHIYPNPSDGKFTFTSEKMIKKGFLKIININGSAVFEERISNTSSKEIHLNGFAPGIYGIEIGKDMEKLGILKLVIIKK